MKRFILSAGKSWRRISRGRSRWEVWGEGYRAGIACGYIMFRVRYGGREEVREVVRFFGQLGRGEIV